MAKMKEDGLRHINPNLINHDSEYCEWIHELKDRYRSSQIKAAVKINSEMLLFNWQLGRDLVIRRAEEKWGKGIVELVSRELQSEFPNAKGFSPRNLWFMKQWYFFYANVTNASNLLLNYGQHIDIKSVKLNQVGSEITENKKMQVVDEIPFPPFFAFVPWRHHVLIIQKCEDVEEALFYIKHTIDESLSRKALDCYIRSDLYHSIGSALTNFVDDHSVPQGELAHDLLKQNYDLGFVNLPRDYDEEALEDAIERRMTSFLLELGNGWAFVGRQKEIIISGKIRKIDLLFYHIYLRCYVVVELKVKPFEPEFVGKLNFYVNAVNSIIRKSSDNPTIGLLICRDLDRTEVQLSFQGITTPMGVATYDNIGTKEIIDQMPTQEQINRQIDLAEAEFRKRN